MTIAAPPGPWTYVEDGDANTYHLRTADGKWLIAFLHNGEYLLEKQRATCRLLAKAPEMRAALSIVADAIHALDLAGGVPVGDVSRAYTRILGLLKELER